MSQFMPPRPPSGLRRSTAAALSVAIVWLAANLPGDARAVVINTVTGTGNTTAPADNPGWSNVGLLGSGTGVYLGDGWVLTTAQVGGGSIVLDGVTYAMRTGSAITLTNNAEPGKSASSDLLLFQLTSTPAGLPSLSIASGATTVSTSVTMIGAGRDRGSFTQWTVDNTTTPWTWTEVSSGGNAAGYQTVGSRTMRWGTNDVTTSHTWFQDGSVDSFVFATTFEDSGSPSTEAQATSGDFGGAVFRKTGGSWQLAGIMLAAEGYSGQPDPDTTAIYGNTMLAADLSFYRSQIVAVVPEPSSATLCVAALIAFAMRRRCHSLIKGRRGRR